MSKTQRTSNSESEKHSEPTQSVDSLEGDNPRQDDYQKYLSSKNGKVLYNSPRSVWNLLFFLETNKIVNYGEKNRYEFDSLFKVNSELTHEELSPELRERYREAKAKDPNTSYIGQVFKVVAKNQLIASCVFGCTLILQVFNPPVLKLYLSWLQDEESEPWKGWVYLVILLMISYSKPFFSQNAVHYLYSSAIQTELLNRVRKITTKIARSRNFFFLIFLCITPSWLLFLLF